MVDYALDEIEIREPDIFLSWRAHTETITAITLINHREIVISSSSDRTCRAWSFDGEYIGKDCTNFTYGSILFFQLYFQILKNICNLPN